MSFLSALGKSVRIVNRVVDENGKKVPYEAYVDGDSFKIEDEIMLPSGVARIIVHNSMYAIDPETCYGQYKLGVAEWGMDVSDLPTSQVQRLELIEREQLPPHRQFGAPDHKTGLRKYTPYRKSNPVRRHDPVAQTLVHGRKDGATAVGFGEAFDK